ncbi:hypothetical protein CDAR_296931 [Caerostris darwini]|uniref:Uncharacterized protein n=1 Tax=Caerostris darwini TaxID=1538125 RepID=A0AAV4UP66_9ARAC|nr:hypothetical protein CDAR_296931 [Caerostris darwini]
MKYKGHSERATVHGLGNCFNSLMLKVFVPMPVVSAEKSASRFGESFLFPNCRNDREFPLMSDRATTGCSKDSTGMSCIAKHSTRVIRFCLFCILTENADFDNTDDISSAYIGLSFYGLLLSCCAVNYIVFLSV